MSDEESKAQKAKAAAVIAKSKAMAPPRDTAGKLRIMTPTVSHHPPQSLEVQLAKSGEDVLLHEQAEHDQESARRASSIVEPAVAESEPKSSGPEPGEDGSVTLTSESPTISPPAQPVLTTSPRAEQRLYQAMSFSHDHLLRRQNQPPTPGLKPPVHSAFPEPVRSGRGELLSDQPSWLFAEFLGER